MKQSNRDFTVEEVQLLNIAPTYVVNEPLNDYQLHLDKLPVL